MSDERKKLTLTVIGKTPIFSKPDGTTLLATGPIASSTDGTQLTIDTIDASTGKVTFHLVHQYLDDGSSAAGNGSASDSVTVNATINNSFGFGGHNATLVAEKFLG